MSALNDNVCGVIGGRSGESENLEVRDTFSVGIYTNGFVPDRYRGRVRDLKVEIAASFVYSGFHDNGAPYRIYGIQSLLESRPRVGL